MGGILNYIIFHTIHSEFKKLALNYFSNLTGHTLLLLLAWILSKRYISLTMLLYTSKIYFIIYQWFTKFIFQSILGDGIEF